MCKKTSVLALSSFCRDPDEEHFLQWLCSKAPLGKTLWSQFVEAQALGVGELLALCPSCCPTISGLLALLQPMPPRMYSVCSSPKTSMNTAAFALSVVHYCSGVTSPCAADPAAPHPKICRRGVCTTYLERMLSKWLHPDRADRAQECRLRIFHKASTTFRLPGNVGHPLILIGPGTGVAPFIGFIEHRRALLMEQENEGDEMSTGVWRGCYELEDQLPGECDKVGQYLRTIEFGPVWLFFGCRNEDDYLFKDVLERRQQDGTLSVLVTAMSRVSKTKAYVTHRMRDLKESLADLVLHKEACVYVCGDGNYMARDVESTLREILSEHGKMTDAEAAEYLREMRSRRRYCQDIWS